MSGFDESILREYFEANGFHVRRLRSFGSGKSGARRSGGANEEVQDFLVAHPERARGIKVDAFVWFTSDLARVAMARVFWRPWHHDPAFSSRMLGRPAELAKFIDSKIAKQVEAILGAGVETPAGMARVLVLPAFPTAEPHKHNCTALLRACGVDAVLSFRSVLDEVARAINRGGVYTRSPELEILRVLQCYDMLKDPQMGLF